MTGSESKVDKLVLVVHGVGDPSPGDTLGIFARSLAEDHHPLGERQTTVWLPEKPDDPNYVKTFPTHIRRLENDRESIELAEVFWGDLSRVFRGLPGAVMGIFQIIFGLRYVAYVAADQPGPAALWLKRLGLCSSRILHGPVLAVTFFLAITAFAVSGTQMMWVDSYKNAMWTNLVLAGCCLFAVATSSVGWKLTRSRIFERFWFWVNITAVFVLGLMLTKIMVLDDAFPQPELDSRLPPGLLWYCRVLVLLLGSLWFSEIAVLVGIGLCWFAALAHPRAHRPGLHLAFLLPALSIGIWGQLLPMIWLSANGGLKKLLQMREFDELFQEAIPLLGVQFMMCVVMAIATAVIGIRFIQWRTKHNICDFANGARPPRLIVHGAVQSVMACCTICGIILVLTIGFLQARGMPYKDYWFGQMMAESNKYAMAVLLPGSFLLVFLIPRLRPVFDIVLDVVNHFYFRATHIIDTLDNEDEFDILETTFEQGTLFFSRRDAIHSRMKRILSFYRKTLNDRPELIVVSHSQGTMIAVEVLNDPELAWLKDRFSSVSLVTMGSPLSNLYQHYFSHCYPSLDRPYWSTLRKHLDRWVNVFRIDDPVGTEIYFPAEALGNNGFITVTGDGNLSRAFPRNSSVRDRGKMVCSNHPVGCRGHVNYWNDTEVLSVLRAELFKYCTDENRYRAA